jgi:acyl carrier protein
MEQKDQVVQKIIERACVLFKKKPEELNENTRFMEDLGAKSGNVSQMTTFLEDTFDVEIAFMEFRRKKTIGEAAEYVAELCNG